MSPQIEPSDAGTTRRAAWSSYWQTGALHSCPTSFSGNYTGAIGNFWADACIGMPERARLLDIATGNGAIPQLLLSSALQHVEIDAVDLAEVAPPWHTVETYPQVRFHTGVAAERLPFSDASFDGICSQFGIEYAKQPAAWLEALRVMETDGRLFCVLHHADSVFTRIARDEATHLHWLLGDEGLIATANRLSPFLLIARHGGTFSDPKTANRARQEFNLIQETLEQRIVDGTHTDVLQEARTNVHAILQRASHPATELERYREALALAHLRCAELTTAAFDQNDTASLLQLLRQHRPSHRIEALELRQAEGLMAWGIRATPD